MKIRQKGFTLIELLTVIAIIGIIATIMIITFGGATAKARDAKRKSELSQIGRFLQASNCYIPDSGPGVYDLSDIFTEVLNKNPQYANFIAKAPRDPKSGNDASTNYKYVLSADRQHCALYANLENKNEPVTLPALTEPTAGGGSGVLKASVAGWNGTELYYQIGK